MRLRVPDLPPWLDAVAAAVDGVPADRFTRFRPPAGGGRPAAVLVLFAGADGPGAPTMPGQPAADLLLIGRAERVSSHAGQPAFPGGAVDPGDDGPIETALREAMEETGLDPAGVAPFAVLPDLYVPVSGFAVTPVLAWWRQPSPVSVVDPREISSVHRVSVESLIDPDNRVLTRHPSGFESPGFLVDGLLVWGFTGGLLAHLIALAGWERPWDEMVVHDVTTQGRVTP